MSSKKRENEINDLLGVPSQANTVPSEGDVLRPSDGTGKDLMIVGQPYDAGRTIDREVGLWNPSARSANADVLPQKSILDARVRDSVRNDAYASAGADIRKDSIVGSMFMLNSRPNTDVLGLDDVWSEEFQLEVEAKFTAFAESDRNFVDASGINNFSSLVRLAVGMSGLTGEILAVGEWIDDGRPFKTSVQMVDLDRLSTPYEYYGNPRVRGGVEVNRYGAPIAYHIRKAHPYDFNEPKAGEYKRVMARKPWGREQVIHIFEQFRPDQNRGVSKMVAALKESRITKRFRDIVLQNAVVNATYAATIESDMSPEAVFQAMGGAGGQMDIAEAVTKYAGGWLGAAGKYFDSAENLAIDGVRIPLLMPGTKLQMRPAGQGMSIGDNFEQSLLRYIAAILGVSYEQLSKDYTKTNYSSARAAMNETHKTMMAAKRMTADRFASSIYLMWLEEAIATGQITSLPRRAPNFWDGLNREAYGACEWIGASRGQIDELKETQAAVLRIKYGLSTREMELGRLGQDWRKTFKQLSREKAIAESLGLVFMEDDNMMNAASGTPREKEASGEKEDGSEDNTDA